ncbi:hypothetical protein [Candidatus Amarobacter glycogenicus]|uniref:hypothetical protein n=1 Tax=Candidatus Amarobacter glycogenicus TaxID=3140699 RepID=UPI002A0F620B|nr:hypothetical protein [Dehalococcoidia bacterium]
MALSLGIPTDIPAAIAILRTGRRIKVDVGMAAQGNMNTPFLEVCSVGLVSTLFLGRRCPTRQSGVAAIS